MEIKHLINERELAKLPKEHLGKALSGVLDILLRNFSKEEVAKCAETESARLRLFTRASLVAFIPEIALFPAVIQYATPLETGIYIALFPTTISLYRELSNRTNVFEKLLGYALAK